MTDFSFPTIITKLLVLFIAFPTHEFAHAWTANYFGDTTPKANGRLTLNPLAHLDIFGSLIFLLSVFRLGKTSSDQSLCTKKSFVKSLLASISGGTAIKPCPGDPGSNSNSIGINTKFFFFWRKNSNQFHFF